MATLVGGLLAAPAPRAAAAGAGPRTPAAPSARAAAPAAPAAAAAASTASADSIQLVSRIPWLTGNNRFHLALSMQSSQPPADLELSLELYPKVTGRSVFEQTLTAPPLAQVLEAQLIPLSALGVQGTTGHTSATVTMNLPVTMGTTGTSKDPAAPTLTLECDLGPPPCDGVYPIEVALVNRSDVPVASFTTFLVYAQRLPNALPMRVGWILPLGGSPSLDAAGNPALDAADEGSIAVTVRDLGLFPKVGVTLQTYGETVLALGAASGASAGTRASSVLAGLRALATSPSRQFVGTTFAPIDPVQFEHAGIATELPVQTVAGQTALREVLSSRIPLSSTQWVLDEPIDHATLAMLARSGVRQLVLPESTLAPDSWHFTPTEPFTLDAGNSPPPTANATGAAGAAGTTGTTGAGAGGQSGGGPFVDAISADPALSAHFSNKGDPVLLAEDLLADLAEIYFELPYAHTSGSGTVRYQPRSVVVQTPAGWHTNDSMLRVVLGGLADAQHDGILLPTTLSGLFAGDPPGADGEPASRALGPAPKIAGTGTLTSAAIAGARSDITAFASVQPSAVTEVGALEQDVLGGEASDITPEASAALLSLPAAAISSIGSMVTLPQGPIVTLTSSRGQVPITIESRSSEPLHLRLVLSAPDAGLRFPGGTSFTFVVGHGTTVQDVQINTLTSGDFGLRLALVTPLGGVQLGHGNVTIRSTALSGLAIGLSAGALALLVAWWIRASRRRRRALAAAAAVAVGAEPPD